MQDPTPEAQLITLLLSRLERISADSVWTHRASGIRGSLLRTLDQIRDGNSPDSKTTTNLIGAAFQILQQAAKEMG